MATSLSCNHQHPSFSLAANHIQQRKRLSGDGICDDQTDKYDILIDHHHHHHHHHHRHHHHHHHHDVKGI
jgi:hypothetical protein